jgi:hypothetical protein
MTHVGKISVARLKRESGKKTRITIVKVLRLKAELYEDCGQKRTERKKMTFFSLNKE